MNTATASTYQPEHLDRWSVDGPTGFDSAANYSGTDLSAFYQAPVALTRDADTLATSNWEVITESILDCATSENTEILRMGHWACGWYEILVIDASDSEALECADRWACSMADYPVASEEHWSELQWNTATEYWERMSLRDRMEACERYDVSVFAARRDEIPECRSGEIVGYLADGC